MPAETYDAAFIRRQNALVGHRRKGLEPAQQRRAEIKADMLKIVDNVGDALGGIQHARECIRGVTFVIDAVIPVVKRRGTILPFDGFGPRIFTRWLVEMSMYCQVTLRH